MAIRNKIKLFESLLSYFHILGTFSPDSSKNRRLNQRNVFVLFIYIQLIVSAFAFTLFKAESLIEYGLNFYGYVTQSLCTFIVLFQIYRMLDILKFIENCELLIERRECSWIMYNKLNEKIERWCKLIYFITAKISTGGCSVPPLLVTLENYFIYDKKDDPYFLPNPVILPFNWKTPFGYLIGLLAQAISAYFALVCVASTLCFLIGSSWLFVTFIEDMLQELSDLNVDQKMDNRNDKDELERFCNIIQFYSDVKQLINEFNLIYEFVVFGFILWTLSTIGSSLLVIQTEASLDLIADPIGMQNISTAFTEMFWSFAICAFFCEFGEWVTNKFNCFDDEIYRCDWYLLPLNTQKLHLILMQNTQQPALIEGYANIWCLRDTFKKTVNKGFSYFMTLRQINA